LSASNTARRMPLFFIVFMQSVNQWMYTVSPQQEERITRNIDMFMIHKLDVTQCFIFLLLDLFFFYHLDPLKHWLSRWHDIGAGSSIINFADLFGDITHFSFNCCICL